MKSLSLIIPVYNEAKRLKKTFAALESLSLPSSLTLKEVIFVDDGSKDNSKFKIQNSKLPLKKALKAPISLISYPENRGKGYAVRQGMLAATGDYALFFDADMSTPLSEIKKFAPFMKQNIDVIIGTRKNGKSTVIEHQPFIREKLGQAFTKMTQIFLNLYATDFTCGFKAFSKEARSVIFPKSIINRWAYDAEIIFLAKKYGMVTTEKAVTWSNDPSTKVTLYKAIPQTVLDLVRIRLIHSVQPVLVGYTNLLRFGMIYKGMAKIWSIFL